jgi:hypothetical protein
MAVVCLRAKRLGLRQSSAAFATGPQGKAPEGWRTPRRCAPTATRSVFTACGAARGTASHQKMAVACLRAKRLGLRQSSAAFATSPQGKGPGDWRTPRRCAPTATRSVFTACGAARGTASHQKMAVGRLRAKRLGLRQSSAAFATSPQGKGPGDWRTPRRCAPTATRSVFTACGAARGMASDQKIALVLRLDSHRLWRVVLVLNLQLRRRSKCCILKAA